jgi:hypothetical protein
MTGRREIAESNLQSIRSLQPSTFNLHFSISFLVVALLTAACVAHGSEQRLLDEFFAASRLRDRTALQHLATVIFEPAQQGTVTAFTIVGVDNLEPSKDGVVAKQVRVAAPVRLPEGGTAMKTIVLVLERRAHWMVTGFSVRSG